MSEITRSEAIAILKGRIDNPLENSLSKEAFKLAIASLETDEAYQLEYESTTKNDLGVDAISREQALNEFCIYNPYDSIGVDKVRSYLKALPPATIRPKGHWKLVQRGKYIDICCSNCELVRVKEYAYNYTIDQLGKKDIKECFESDDMRYCPYCGSDNREVKE